MGNWKRLVACLGSAFALSSLAAPVCADVGDATMDPYSVSVCDLTGDGTAEQITAAPGVATLANGSVTVFDGATGMAIAQLNSGLQETLFGIGVSASADVDLDGRPDLVIAGVEVANGVPTVLLLHFYSSASWKELAFIKESLLDVAADPQVSLVGDADASGAVDLLDAARIAETGVGDPGIEDVNRDGTVDSVDVFEVIDRAEMTDAATSAQVLENIGAQARASWWWCTKKGFTIAARIGLFITTVAGCEVNPPLCVLGLLCQACGIITDVMDFLLQCFGDPVPEMLEALDSVRWACDMCTAGTTIFNPGTLKEGIKRIWRQFAGVASASMANEFSPCGLPE